MKAQSFFEQNGGTYMQGGDYYIPDLKDEEPGHYPIGKYGRMRKRYLQEHRPILFSNLILSGKLYQHLAETDHACKEQGDHGAEPFYRCAEGYAYGWWLKDLLENVSPLLKGYTLKWK